MPDFPRRPPVSHAIGGTKLRPDAGAILKSCQNLGPLFVLFRSEVSIFGSVADPLVVVERANVRLAASGALTLNLAQRRPCSAFAYVEPGPQGGFIDAVEVCGPRDRGFLKVCRMDATDRPGWQSLLSSFHQSDAPAASIAGIRKTNHLDVPPGADAGPSPAERVIERFLAGAVHSSATLHIIAQAWGARGRLTIRPTHRVRVGHWSVLSSDTTAFHVAPGCVGELRVVRRPHVVQLILFGTDGRFAARILTRDREILSQLDQIL